MVGGEGDRRFEWLLRCSILELATLNTEHEEEEEEEGSDGGVCIYVYLYQISEAMRRATFNKTTPFSPPLHPPPRSIANDALVVVTESHKITSTRDEPIDPDPPNEPATRMMIHESRSANRLFCESFLRSRALFPSHPPPPPYARTHAHVDTYYSLSVSIYLSILNLLEVSEKCRGSGEKNSRHDAMIRRNLSGGGAQLGK